MDNSSTLLLIIDVQFAFINLNTEFLIQKISNLVNENIYDKVVFTRFVNTIDSIYAKRLNYKECISENKELAINTLDNTVIDKYKYSALTLELKDYIKKNNIGKIYLCGIDTECCVLKTAFDLFEEGYDVYVLKDYCACTHGIKKHNNALEILERNIGKDRII